MIRRRSRPLTWQQRAVRGIKSRAQAIALLPHLLVAIWRTSREGPGQHVLADRPTWVIKRLIHMRTDRASVVLRVIPLMAVDELLRRSITREPS